MLAASTASAWPSVTPGGSWKDSGLAGFKDFDGVAWYRTTVTLTEAQAKAGTTVTYNGTPVIENSQIPPALRGYVQYAIDKGFLEVYPAQVVQTGPGQFQALPGPRVDPSNTVTRAALASKLNNFAAKFAAGN